MKAIALMLALATPGLANAERRDIVVEGITRPTIKSEMNRGDRVGFKCSVGAYNVRQVRTCLEKAIDSNVQSNTATDAFMLGLYFSAWKHARINAELPGGEDWTYATICYVRNVQKYRSALGLTMDEVMSESGDRVYQPKRNEWEAKHRVSAVNCNPGKNPILQQCR